MNERERERERDKEERILFRTRYRGIDGVYIL